MDKFKKNILYNELKADIEQGQTFSSLKDKIEKKNEGKEIKKNIVQTNFNSSEELRKELDKNKKFHLLNYELWLKICEEDKKNDFGINYILDEDKIILIFNDNDKIIFKNNNGIIEKASLDIFKLKEENKNDNYFNGNKNSNNYNLNNFVNNNQQPNYKVNNNQNFNQLQLLQKIIIK